VDEQAVRAAIFEKLGLLRVLPQQELTPETLATEIIRTLEFKPAQRTLRGDGATQTREIVHKWRH
jgi:predicted glycosyltransferase